MDTAYPLELCEAGPDKVVCRCLQISEATILKALANNELRSLHDIRQLTGAGEGCTCCHALLEDYLHAHERKVMFSLQLVG